MCFKKDSMKQSVGIITKIDQSEKSVAFSHEHLCNR